MTLVSAPAGFGRTTLLAEWLAADGRRAGWLSLDRRDNDPTTFWTYLVTALRTAVPEVGGAALSLLDSPRPPIDEVLPPERVEGNEELPGDRGTGEVDVEKAQDLELSFAERVGRDPRTAGATSAGEAAGNVSATRAIAPPRMREIVETQLDDEHRTALPATHPRPPPRTSPLSMRDRPRCHRGRHLQDLGGVDHYGAPCVIRSPRRRRMIARASSTVPGTAHNTQVM